MCWKTRNSIEACAKQAEKDIVCYKIVLKDFIKYTKVFGISLKFLPKSARAIYYQSYVYLFGQNNPIVHIHPFYLPNDGYYINEGYHSYSEKCFIIQNQYCILKCIIPKGTIYYFNGIELVSKNIIVKKILK